MLEMTADYVRERKQFGVPVGSFQAVKHHLANARIALEFARPLVYRAAASIAAGDPDAGLHASMAKAKADAAALQPVAPRSSATVRSATRPSTTCTST